MLVLTAVIDTIGWFAVTILQATSGMSGYSDKIPKAVRPLGGMRRQASWIAGDMPALRPRARG